jgi:hypothetical protein
MSRYVYEVQPYHTVRELEMDRIMKAKYQQKFFSKREKKNDELPTSRKITSRPDDVKLTTTTAAAALPTNELLVPEREPFKKAFAVNGYGHDEVEKV